MLNAHSHSLSASRVPGSAARVRVDATLRCGVSIMAWPHVAHPAFRGAPK